jgi:hypothetical protein
VLRRRKRLAPGAADDPSCVSSGPCSQVAHRAGRGVVVIIERIGQGFEQGTVGLDPGSCAPQGLLVLLLDLVAPREPAVAERLRRVDNRRMGYLHSLFGAFCSHGIAPTAGLTDRVGEPRFVHRIIRPGQELMAQLNATARRP